MSKIQHKTNKSKRHSKLCRNHGQCPVCRGNRTYADRKRRYAADSELRMIEEQVCGA